jgi:regulator of ribonuclease activity A
MPSKLSFTPTCDLYDKFLEQARIPAIDWRSFGQKKQFCGPAYTIQCRNDNSRLKEAVDEPGLGRILVVNNAGGSKHCAIIGDMLAKTATKNGWEGIIIHGCVRDVDELAQLDLGILALGSTPRKSTRRGEGIVQVEVEIGGVHIQPSDLVFADNDGVLVIDPTLYYNASD